ncbi:MAG: hypothetical protein Ct9H90mP16_21460 [Candidatus Poseidoniales archaeon]|nr:MAG: hypothetical protein Ct9H90mP16_21460 [Candidatus Poseidoniales archaeon]
MDPTTLMILIAAGLVVLMILFWIMGTYNRMVDLRNEVENQYQNLETQVGVKDQKVALVEQTDLAQLGLESEIYDKIVEARKLFAQAKNSGNRSALSKASGMMDSVLPSALAFAESNPQLTSHNVLVAGPLKKAYTRFQRWPVKSKSTTNLRRTTTPSRKCSRL